MEMTFHVNERVELSEVLDLLKRLEKAHPTEDAHRLIRVVPQANIVVTARDGRKLVGLARGLKECSGCCYLSDLIVDPTYGNMGEKLIREVRQAIGENTLIVLVPAPDAMAYSAEID